MEKETACRFFFVKSGEYRFRSIRRTCRLRILLPGSKDAVSEMKNRIKHHTNQKISGESFNKYEVLEKILPIVENTTMRYGVIPVETNFAKENKHWFLRIYIYSPEREVTLDDCENISRSLSAFLDELIPVSFVLEVSSPGMDRKLKSDREYLIFKGRDIQIKLRHGLNDGDETKFVCKIVDFDEKEGLRVYSYKDKNETVIPKDNIIKAELYSEEI